MTNILEFPEPKDGSFLVSLDLYRFPDGQIRSAVTYMPEDLIDTTGREVPDRMRIVAGWVAKGAESLVTLAAELDEAANDQENPHG